MAKAPKAPKAPTPEDDAPNFDAPAPGAEGAEQDPGSAGAANAAADLARLPAGTKQPRAGDFDPPAFSATAYPTQLYHATKKSREVRNPTEYAEAHAEGYRDLAEFTDLAQRKAIHKRG